MKNLWIIGLVALASLVFFVSCGTKPKAADNDLMLIGAEVVGLSQAELLMNVAGAMGAGGPGHAVDFCNVHALDIKDSLSEAYSCDIRRISLKFRNPEDEPAEGIETEVLMAFQESLEKGDSLVAVVHDFEDRSEYYHPILIDNPACLLCHGAVGETINEQTMEMIQTHYPGDLATGYQIGDLRGAWKITFSKP